MTKEEFQKCVDDNRESIEEIRQHAHMLHDSVNQRYGMKFPYSVHLDMVGDVVFKYGHMVCQSEDDVLPLFFGAFYHDSIEDARLSYNDVKKGARLFMNDEQAFMAAEMVYALTNDKGRTRAERAGEHYYAGIRETPYAPFLKLADRMANITFTCSGKDEMNNRMKKVYKDELPHFLEAINAHSEDPRQALPQVMIDKILQML